MNCFELVQSWLNQLPEPASPPVSASIERPRPAKRQKLDSNKFRLPSPAQSQSVTSCEEKFRRKERKRHFTMDPATPATPVNKRKTPHNAIGIDGLGEDTEITPRPGKAPSAGPGSTASSVMRDAPSLTSQSDTSQKSGRSSPVKTFPIIGMEGHVIYSKPLDPDDHALPPELVDLLCDLDTINDKAGIIPKSLKAEIERQEQPDMTLKWIRRSSHVYAPDDEFGLIPGCLITAKNHLSRVKMLVEFAKRARELGFDETMWNNEVHTPTLQFAFRGDQWLDNALVDSLSCMNASPRADYYKFPIPLSRVDYTLFINPAVDKDTRVREAIGSLSAALGGFINHTTSGSFSSFPLALSIETKRYGGDQRKADVQTATWHASQWTFLQSLAGDKISELPFLPGIVVHAHEWKFVATSRKGNETILWSSCPIGSAITIVGVFQILAGLRRLRKWCEEVYWPWYKKNILQLGEDTG